MKKMFLPVFGILLVVSCVTFVVTENEAEKIIDLINTGNAEVLAEISQTPFLLDAEIIALENDVAVLWKNLAEAGFRLQNAVLEELVPVKDDTYTMFSGSFEVKIFFKKYVPPNSKVARIRADNGEFLLLLDGENRGYAQIIGIKGP